MRLVVSAFLILIIFGFNACENPNAVVDEQQPIENASWNYAKKIRIPVKIEDSSIPYNLLINLRHSADYRYSNIFIRIRQLNPDKKSITLRKEYTLAKPDGEWLGTGSGNLYSYQLPLYSNYRFPVKGNYVFELEQNMRDNPLRDITDVGLRVEKVGK